MRALLVFSVLLIAGVSSEVIRPSQPSECKNGGVFNDAVADEKTCDCQSYWKNNEEQQVCDELVCVNGGYKGDDNYCHCPRGYYGIHCDAVKLARPVEEVFETKKTKSFNLYIHNELTDWYGKEAFARIQRDVPNIIKDYGTTFTSYNLFVSDATNDVKSFYTGANQTAFSEELAGLKAATTTKYYCGESNIAYKSLLEALRTKKIEDSVVLMFTQYYPKTKDDANLAELKKYLRAFRIKLNVLIGSDDILLDCNSKKNKDKDFFEELKALAHFTDGEASSFLIEDERTEDELLPSFIRSSASPQSHARTASHDCEKGAALSFQTDPYPNTYYIAVRTTKDKPAAISGTCSSGGEVSEIIPSYYGEFSLFTIRSGAQQNCDLFVKADTECLATVYSVGGEPDVDSFEIFHSFTTSADMDTDSISSYQEEEVFLTMHIEVPANPKYKIKSFTGTVTVINELTQVVAFEKNLTARSSTFEYQSEEQFPCPTEGASWIQLKLDGFTSLDAEKPVATLNRMIHLNCEQRKATADSSLKLLRLMDEATTPTNETSTLVLMYSNELPIQEFSNFILESVDASVVQDKFKQFGYLRFDAKESKDLQLYDSSDKGFADFKKAVYDTAPDASLTYQNNLKSYIEKLTASSLKKITSDTLVSIAIQHSLTDPNAIPDSNFYPSNLALLANLGAKLLFIGNVDTVKIAQETDSLEVYTRMAAVSAGHVVLMDMTDFSDDGDMPFYVSLALNDLYSYGPSQRLLSYSNLEWEQTSITTSQSKQIGTLQIPKETTEVFVSITLNVRDPSDVAQAFMLSVVLEGINERIVLNAENFTQYGTPGYVRSNLYTANIAVVGGESYAGTFTVLAMTPYTGAHIRFWTARTSKDTIPDLNYVNFEKQNNIIQPDDYLGAALRARDSVGKTMSLRFIDENGEEGNRLDHQQTVDVIDGQASFIPYFCNSNQSDSLSKDMYTIEISYEGGFKYFRPMLCTASNKPESDFCSGKEFTIDEDGNVFCKLSNPPFLRGPSGKLIDCNEGQVKYIDGVYKCFCEGTGYSGVSCEISTCDKQIVHSPGERDAKYRTISFVFINPGGDDWCSNINFNYADDAKALFKQDTRDTSYDDIWQYTFTMYFSDGTARTMYRGPNKNDFMAVFEELKKIDPETFCGVDVVNKPIDIGDVFDTAVQSVGRESRGLVILYAVQSFLDEPDVNQLDKLVVSEAFYQSLQAYKQQIIMITPLLTDEIVRLTTASGGFAIKMIDDYAHNFKANKALAVFDKIIEGQIGWIGIATNVKSAEWTISDAVEVFISTNVTDKNFLTITVDGTARPLTSNDLMPFDSDFAEDPFTAWITVPTTAGKIMIEIAEDKEGLLLQVVVVSTQTDPIQYALLGQGQSKVDKHSAGATTNSSKAIHISFDRDDEVVWMVPTDKNWREAARDDCVFAQEFIPFDKPFSASGPFVVDFTTYADRTAGSPPVSSLSVPLVVTERIKCVNGVFMQGSYCKCDDNWSGPTCSQPTCGEGGQINSHGDHCDCSGAQFGGLFCKDPNPPQTTVDPLDSTSPDLEG